jgi:hypothetical protein
VIVCKISGDRNPRARSRRLRQEAGAKAVQFASRLLLIVVRR